MTEGKIILEIDGGDKQVYPGSVNLDIRETPHVDIIVKVKPK